MKMPLKNSCFPIICSFMLIAQQSFAEKSEIDNIPKKSLQSKEKKHAGSSISNPIVIKGVKTYEKVLEKQDDYIREQYEGYKILVDEFSLEDNQRFIQHYILENEDGEYADIYFDITDICKSSRKLKYKDLEEKINKSKKSAKYQPRK